MNKSNKATIKALNAISSKQRHLYYKLEHMRLRVFKMRNLYKKARVGIKGIGLIADIQMLEVQKRILIETPIPKYHKGGEPQSAIYYENGVECIIPEGRKALDANYRQVGNYAEKLINNRKNFAVAIAGSTLGMHHLVNHDPKDILMLGGQGGGKTYAVQQAIYEALNKLKNDTNKG